MFIEEGPGYKGKRLFLTKVREEDDLERINALQRRSYQDEQKLNAEARFLVHFNVEKELPLVGSGGK
jgi:hypothetical protein